MLDGFHLLTDAIALTIPRLPVPTQPLPRTTFATIRFHRAERAAPARPYARPRLHGHLLPAILVCLALVCAALLSRRRQLRLQPPCGAPLSRVV